MTTNAPKQAVGRPQIQSHFQRSFVSVSDQIAIHGRFRARDIALIEGERQVDWAQYNAAGNRIAHALQAAGVCPGDRVATLAANNVWAHEILLGIWRAGAVIVPLSPLLTADVLAGMLADSGSVLLLASESYNELASAAVAKAATTKTPTGGSPVKLLCEGDAFAEFLGDHSAEAPGIELTPDDLAVIIYSSGTTGTPKGIAHSHGGRLAFANGCAAELRFHYYSVTLSTIPLHSNGAWLGWLPTKLMGGTTVILPQFSADAFFSMVRQHRPTHGFLVPTICAALLQHPDVEEAGLDCYECALTAGSPMPVPMKQAMQRLTGNALYELWGLTEGVATIICPQDMEGRLNAVGRPLIGCDIRLIDGDDRDVTFTGTGEIVGHSSGLMAGYWNRPQANAELVWRDAHGKIFIRTGDIGEFDADGFLTLRGRAKDMIISGGINVYPIDIETTLISHEAVTDAAVIGVEHPKWGETPVGFVILASGADTDMETLKTWANQRLAKHQRLNDLVVHAGDFPRNTLGKVLKNELRAAYRPR